MIQFLPGIADGLHLSVHGLALLQADHEEPFSLHSVGA
jgi:hypothetical protein